MKRFPDGFMWGASTSAYQIEGAVDEDGRGRSIWDTFSHTPGKIDGGGTGDVACDHYHRWRDDVDLISSLNLNTYRFSLAWPRLFPDGVRREQRGFDHYQQLIETLLQRGIEPVVTLYHWDLPQALEDRGGWRARETTERFAEYAAACFDAFGDRIQFWLTINEPWIVGLLGYRLGLHAPGYTDDLRGEVTVFHHLLLAHGRAVEELRARHPSSAIGLAPNLFPHYPLTDADDEAVRGSDGYTNRWFLDATLRGEYPFDQQERYEQLVGPLDFIHGGDLETISRRTDYLGVNYYAPRWMQTAPGEEPWPWRVVVPRGTETTAGFTAGVPQTDAGTPIVPGGLTDLLVRIRDDYGDVPILVTENGAVFAEPVHDHARVAFIHDHLAAVHEAIEKGVRVIGYCHWSLLDNFEWALGYAQRFGIVHVDYETLARTVKNSGRYYARVAAANELVAA